MTRNAPAPSPWPELAPVGERLAPPLALGFAHPVFDSQAVFRAVMDALAQPGRLRPLAGLPGAPHPLTPELAAVALALADYEAPLWLDAPLAATPEVADFLRFHTGAIVADPADASFALISDPACCPALDRFAPGTPEYPDRSATLVLAVRDLAQDGSLVLEGPGILGQARLHAYPLPPDMTGRLMRNRAGFPRGVDHLLVAPGWVAGLPRTTRVMEG